MKVVVCTGFKPSKGSPIWDLVLVYAQRFSQDPKNSLQFLSSRSDDPSQSLKFFQDTLKQSHLTHKIHLIVLDEKGKKMNSVEFSQHLEQKKEVGAQTLLIWVGGSYGIPAIDLTGISCQPISLSDMTFPHEMATLLILEQLYRASLISKKHPYHHAEVSSFAQHHLIRS
jgi:rRNA large subunit m3Psi methyltransferase RlmH